MYCIKFDDGTYLALDGSNQYFDRIAEGADDKRVTDLTLADVWCDAEVAKGYMPKGGRVVNIQDELTAIERKA